MPESGARERSARGATTFAGLRHLAVAPDEICDLDVLLAAIDEAKAAATDPETFRDTAVALIAERLAGGRGVIRAALLARPLSGLRIARSYTYLTDCIVAATVYLA
ncbi:MAG: hypothetical protein AAF334_09395, partial [Pseudomonadota bacterium]